MPALAHEVMDRQAGQGHGTDAPVSSATGVAGNAVEADVERAAANRGMGNSLWAAAIEIPGQLGAAQFSRVDIATTEQAEFFLHCKQQR